MTKAATAIASPATSARPPLFYAVVSLDLVENGTRTPSLYLKNYRIAGGKPWGGGASAGQYPVRRQRIIDVLDACQGGDNLLELSIRRSPAGVVSIILGDAAIVGRKSAQAVEVLHQYQVQPSHLSCALRL
jgi:hypothetical protein